MPDSIIRSLGVPLVTGDIPGVAVILGTANEATQLAMVVKEYQNKGLLTFLIGDVIDQAAQAGVRMGLDFRVVLLGHDITAVIHVVTVAIRAALIFGAIQPGDLAGLLKYTKERVPAFVNTFGPLSEVAVAAGAGAIALGFPVIVDVDLSENQVPGALVSVTNHVDTVKKSLELRNIKVKAKNIEICMGFSSAFEGEIIRKSDMHAEFWSGANPTCELVAMRGLEEIEDHKITIIGPDIDSVEILDITADTGSAPVCGLAVDIGTTTVTAVLVDLESGKILSKASAGNAQIRYGADVINRIVEQQKPGGVKKLQKAVISETLMPLIDLLCREAGVSQRRIFRMTVASNTTMNHLFLGINANFLRTEPYVPAFFSIRPILASALGISLAPAAKICFAPNIGSYVGGDITAGVLASMIWDSDELSMLIDLGTNGEIVFGNRDFLVACACSAGPAFEGGDISCGMRATHGAIEAVKIDRETMEPAMKVIGNIHPVGLCGSGLIDLIAELFRCGIINGKGEFIREGRRIGHDEYGIGYYVLAFPNESASGRQVAITQVDIDNFIRAKAAIFSAIMALLSSLGFTPDVIEHIYVAGGIGSGINIPSAIPTGLLFPSSEVI
ncbi:MAG: ASKHA domain-containing protein [Oscillospiraceae bacterium]